MKTDSGKPVQSLSDTEIAYEDRDVPFMFMEGLKCHVQNAFSFEQCCYLIEVYFSNNKSFKETRQLFKEKFDYARLGCQLH